MATTALMDTLENNFERLILIERIRGRAQLCLRAALISSAIELVRQVRCQSQSK